LLQSISENKKHFFHFQQKGIEILIKPKDDFLS